MVHGRNREVHIVNKATKMAHEKCRGATFTWPDPRSGRIGDETGEEERRGAPAEEMSWARVTDRQLDHTG